MDTQEIIKRMYQSGVDIKRFRRHKDGRYDSYSYEAILPKHEKDSPPVRELLESVYTNIRVSPHSFSLSRTYKGDIRVNAVIYKCYSTDDEWKLLESNELKRRYSDDVAF